MHILRILKSDWLLHVITLLHTTFYTYLIFSFYRLPFQILHFLPKNHTVLLLLTDRHLKKMLKNKQTNKQTNLIIFFSQNYRLNNFFYSSWKQFLVLKTAKFEFKVTVHYGLHGFYCNYIVCFDTKTYLCFAFHTCLCHVICKHLSLTLKIHSLLI